MRREIELSLVPLSIHQVHVSGKVAGWTWNVRQSAVFRHAGLINIVLFVDAGFDLNWVSFDSDLVGVERDCPQSSALVIDEIAAHIGYCLSILKKHSHFAGAQFQHHYASPLC